MQTYLGLTQEELNDSYIYDKENGRVLSRRSEKEVGTLTPSGLVIKKRLGKKVINLSVGKMCYFMLTGISLGKDYKIKYKDDDCCNLKPNNLVAVKFLQGELTNTRQPLVATEHKGIFFNPNEQHWVVRRGPTQSVYRTYNYNEAVSIRKEWESDHSIHKWDKSCRIVMERLGL